MLSKFSVIVAHDHEMGIGKEGKMPWPKNSEDMKRFKLLTSGHIVIMGRKTFESLDAPLSNRMNIVITRNPEFTAPGIHTVLSPIEALELASSYADDEKENKKIWVIGGEQVYNYFLTHYMYLVDAIYVTKIHDSPGGCDTFFKLPENVKVHVFDSRARDHPEYEYLNLLQKILEEGIPKPDRTGVGTLSLHGQVMNFDISEQVPLITTKKLFHKTVLKELLWFLDGSTNSKLLEEQGVNIWKGNSSKEFIESRGLKYEPGDIGPGYGFQWRHWGAEYKGCNEDYTGQGIDQIENIVQGLINDPMSRRHILTAWNPDALDQMVLPPCHYSAQFLVRDGYLDCILNQRSGDMFLGVPFNIASYSFLTYMIATKTELKPGKLTHVIGDAHIYNNHIEQVKEQLSRTPLPWCTVEMDENDVPCVKDYISWPAIKADMAI